METKIKTKKMTSVKYQKDYNIKVSDLEKKLYSCSKENAIEEAIKLTNKYPLEKIIIVEIQETRTFYELIEEPF